MKSGRRVAATIAAVGFVAACGDTYYADLELDSSWSGPAKSASFNDGGTTIFISHTDPILCPPAVQAGMALPPTIGDGGAACDLPGAVCEYGGSADPQCNDVYACASDGTSWELRPHDKCFQGICPRGASVASLEGLPCDLDGGTDADEAICDVTDGVCACTTGSGGDDVHPRRWTCMRPIVECPSTRPTVGQPCGSTRLCDYGACRSKRGAAMFCLDGVWVETTIDCKP